MEQEKHYSCTVHDCNMQFVSETHLAVHKKKHDMILHLGFKTNPFAADQTPTPTQFIRKCEEVGLFQDLQNVNPFEETFRKAAEAVKTGSVVNHQYSMLSVKGNLDDSLHTPHVFPHILDAETISKTPLNKTPNHLPATSNTEYGDNEKAQRVVRQEADTSLKLSPAISNQISVLVESSGCDGRSKNGDAPIVLLRMPGGDLVRLSASPVSSAAQPCAARIGEDEQSPTHGGRTVILTTQLAEHSKPVSPLTATSNKTKLIKQRLKETLLSNSSSGTNHEVVPAKVALPRRMSMWSEQDSHSEREECNGEEEEEEGGDKRRKFLERNRAAAMRCREKRKSWVQDLERRAQVMLSTNQQLQMEVASLRFEVAQLKTLLLAHKDCPVTQAMQQVEPTQIFKVSYVLSKGQNLLESKRPPQVADNITTSQKDNKRLQPGLIKSGIRHSQVTGPGPVSPLIVIKQQQDSTQKSHNVLDKEHSLPVIVINPPQETNSRPHSTVTTPDPHVMVINTSPHVVRKRLSPDDDSFRRNLHKKLRGSLARRMSLSVSPSETQKAGVEMKKRLSLDTDPDPINEGQPNTSAATEGNERLSSKIRTVAPDSLASLKSTVIQINPHALRKDQLHNFS